LLYTDFFLHPYKFFLHPIFFDSFGLLQNRIVFLKHIFLTYINPEIYKKISENNLKNIFKRDKIIFSERMGAGRKLLGCTISLAGPNAFLDICFLDSHIFFYHPIIIKTNFQNFNFNTLVKYYFAIIILTFLKLFIIFTLPKDISTMLVYFNIIRNYFLNC